MKREQQSEHLHSDPRVCAGDTRTGLPLRSQAEVVAGRQRNHGSWCLPAGLGFSNNPPLWLAVSVWIMKQARAVTRHEVAQAFRITPRRAADVMTYIVCDRTDTVQIRKEVLRVGSGHRVAHYVVEAVAPVVAQQATPRPPAPVPDKRGADRERDERSLVQARQAFLFQRRAAPDMR